MPYPITETVTVLDGTVTASDWGDAAHAWPVKTTLQVVVAPRDGNGTSGNERDEGQTQVTVGLTIFVPDGANIAAVDRVVCRGRTWEVDGEAEFYVSPFTGWAPGAPIALKRVTG